MTLPLRGRSWGSAGHAFEVAKRRGAQRLDYLLAYARALWADCDALGLRADVAWAQADLESGDRATGIGFQSARYVEEGNTIGYGITTGMPDSQPGRDGASGGTVRVLFYAVRPRQF